MNTNEKYEMIVCVVNAGYSDTVMDAARDAGVSGGTVFHARGTANKEAEAFFHITIQPEKDIVMMLVPAEIKDRVLHAIYKHAGLQSEGQGIAFSTPVSNAIGLTKLDMKKKAETEEKTEEITEE